MRKYLVTGGCGFIGSHLADALLAQGHRVSILDDLSTGDVANASKGAQLITGDIRDPETVASAMAGCDGCFHLAAVASVERSTREWVGTHRVNLTGTIQVFDAARRVGRDGRPVPVVYASSAAVYGDHGHRAIDENTPQRPTSAYGADKLACEHHARVATLVYGVPTVGLRFFNVYGPRQNPKSPYSGVISIFSDRIASDQTISIFGDGEQTRDFVYVADVVRALTLAMTRSCLQPRVLNVCTGRRTSVNELVLAIACSLGRKPNVAHLPARQGEIRDSLGDVSAARQALGFEAATSLSQGLALTAQAYPSGARAMTSAAIRMTSSPPA